MLKVVDRKYKEYFSEFFKRILTLMDLVFGFEFTKVNPINHLHTFICKLDLSIEGSLSHNYRLSKTGQLMALL